MKHWIIAGLMLAAARPAIAQHPGVQGGVEGLYNFKDFDRPGAGLQFLAQVAGPIGLHGGISKIFISGGSFSLEHLAVTAGLRRGRVLPYAGGGIAFTHSKVTGGLTVNRSGPLGVAGAESQIAFVRPFVELQVFRVSGVTSSQVAAGVRFRLNGGFR